MMDLGQAMSLSNASSVTSYDNCTSFHSSPPPLSTPLVSESTLDIFSLTCFGILIPVITPVGVLTNLLNILVFKRLGLKDSITICFFCLSCSDLLCLILGFGSLSFTYLAGRSDTVWPVEPLNIGYLLVWYYLMFYDVSTLLVTFIAIQRCCCVAFPLSFRDTFTRKRAAFVVSGIIIACALINIPLFVTQGLQEETTTDANMNGSQTTRLVLWFSEERYDILFINDLLMALILPSLSQFIILICFVVLTIKLRESIQFRSAKSREINSPAGEQRPQEGKDVSDGASEKYTVKDWKSTGKEYQAAVAAAVVSFIFILCNTPNIVITYAVLSYPELNVFRREHYLYLVLKDINNVCEFVNISVNAFVYFTFNTKYRTEARKVMLCWRGQTV